MAAPALKALAAAFSARQLVGRLGGSYARGLGILLGEGSSDEVFKWFLAALLYGAPISEIVAGKTYLQFAQAGVATPQAVLKAGWDGLVSILDRGGYARYDYKTATKLLAACNALLTDYGGDLNALHRAAATPQDLEARLMRLAKGIGEVTVNIFLRELRGVWQKAEPLPRDGVVAAAKELGLLPRRLANRREALARLKRRWRDEGGAAADFADLEAALQRQARLLRHGA